MDLLLFFVAAYIVWMAILLARSQSKSGSSADKSNSYLIGHAIGKALSSGSNPTSGAKSKELFTWPTTGFCGFDIVGESHYQKALKTLAGEHGPEGANKDCTATIVPDDNNQYDDKAVRIDIDGLTVGHLDRDDARSFRRRLGAKKLTGQPSLCGALIVGGYIDKKGQVMSYGVKLDIKDFG